MSIIPRDLTEHIRLLLLILILSYLCFSCSNGGKKAKREVENTPTSESAANEPLTPSGRSGEMLAKTYCASCHAFVDPQLLPKSIWKNDVLPAMGQRLGIYSRGFRPNNLFDPGVSGTIVRKANIYPENPMLALEDWHKIVQFFVEQAPDSVAPPHRESDITIGLKHFKYKEAPFVHRPAMTTMVRLLPGSRGLVFSDSKAERNVLTFLNDQLREDYSLRLPLAPVQLSERSNEIYLTLIGRNVFPNDAPNGTLQRLKRNWPDPQYKPANVVLRDLQRPVCMAYGDLNQDSLEDIVVCEFGNHTGRLSWYENNGQGGYTKRILQEKSGAVSAVIRDANADGLPDIYVLMAQGDESVFLYENQGAGKFEEKRLLSFSPLNGSQYIELADFNNDGFDDILYVCGDNADKTPILKRYHGIYIFLNDGNLNFNQAWFYQMNGAYKAIARDFDLDGDLDIAAISFFPDYIRHPEESFVYLENRGGLRFKDYSFPEASKGRWMVMDAADKDGDGDIDLALGSFVYFLPDGDTTGLGKRWLETSPSVIVLENTIR